jgi:hypothetical protein
VERGSRFGLPVAAGAAIRFPAQSGRGDRIVAGGLIGRRLTNDGLFGGCRDHVVDGEGFDVGDEDGGLSLGVKRAGHAEENGEANRGAGNATEGVPYSATECVAGRAG